MRQAVSYLGPQLPQQAALLGALSRWFQVRCCSWAAPWHAAAFISGLLLGALAPLVPGGWMGAGRLMSGAIAQLLLPPIVCFFG